MRLYASRVDCIVCRLHIYTCMSRLYETIFIETCLLRDYIYETLYIETCLYIYVRMYFGCSATPLQCGWLYRPTSWLNGTPSALLNVAVYCSVLQCATHPDDKDIYWQHEAPVPRLSRYFRDTDFIISTSRYRQRLFHLYKHQDLIISTNIENHRWRLYYLKTKETPAPRLSRWERVRSSTTELNEAKLVPNLKDVY